MPNPYTAAFDAIERFIKTLLPHAELAWAGNAVLRVSNGTHSVSLPFTRAQLDDYEIVLKGDQPVRYSNGVRSDLQFGICVALGLEGFVPELAIVEHLLRQEDRDWLESCRITGTRFSSECAKGLYEGLLDLQASLRATLDAGVEVPEEKEELEVVESLTAYYEKHRHLDSPDVQLASLSYLKAGALCWVLRLQTSKTDAASQRVKLAFDKKIYEIVRQFWLAHPYHRIHLPPAVYDLVAMRNRSTPTPIPDRRPHIDIGPMLEELDPRLRDRWRGSWAALASENPDRVSQAANSMVEVLDKVIDRVRGNKEFRDYLADRFPRQAEVVVATRTWISKIKDSLHVVKHHTEEQSPDAAKDLMHQAEWIINLLLR